MQIALNNFEENIKRIRQNISLIKVLISQSGNVVDYSDFLRAQIVLTVSALDFYIHQVVKMGMLEIYNSTRLETNAYKKFGITMEDSFGHKNAIDDGWLIDVIHKKHSWQSFQSPEKIKEAISLIKTFHLWQEVSNILNLPLRDVTTRLSLIVDRRNKIAHEADMNPSTPGLRWHIDVKDTENVVDFIDSIVRAIHALI